MPKTYQKRHNQKGGAGTDFSGLFHANTVAGNNAVLSEVTLKYIDDAPMFHPFSTNTIIPTGTSGIIPTGIYLAHTAPLVPGTMRTRNGYSSGKANRQCRQLSQQAQQKQQQAQQKQQQAQQAIQKAQQAQQQAQQAKQQAQQAQQQAQQAQQQAQQKQQVQQAIQQKQQAQQKQQQGGAGVDDLYQSTHDKLAGMSQSQLRSYCENPDVGFYVYSRTDGSVKEATKSQMCRALLK